MLLPPLSMMLLRAPCRHADMLCAAEMFFRLFRFFSFCAVIDATHLLLPPCFHISPILLPILRHLRHYFYFALFSVSSPLLMLYLRH